MRFGTTHAFILAATTLGAGALLAAEAKPKKPRLELRATPRMAFSPVNVFLTAELTGGDDVEEYYCPELEWEWDDGGKSTQESDCTPFEPGTTKIERRFTTDHEYRRAGVYNVKVTMRRAGRNVATASVRVTVRPGLGDRSTMEPN
jgi:PKD domain